MSESLQKAREELSTLQSELPNFEALLADNRHAAETLRREHADLSKQAEAKGRVNVAREMLEQHLSDIDSAQAEVSRLEVLASRGAILATMADHAEQAQTLRERYDSELKAAASQLEKHLDILRSIKAGLAEARTGFFAAGRALAPDAFRVVSVNRNISRAENVRNTETVAPIFAELAGIDLSYVLTTYNPLVQFQLDDPNSPHKYHHDGKLEQLLNEKSGL